MPKSLNNKKRAKKDISNSKEAYRMHLVMY